MALMNQCADSSITQIRLSFIDKELNSRKALLLTFCARITPREWFAPEPTFYYLCYSVEMNKLIIIIQDRERTFIMDLYPVKIIKGSVELTHGPV